MPGTSSSPSTLAGMQHLPKISLHSLLQAEYHPLMYLRPSSLCLLPLNKKLDSPKSRFLDLWQDVWREQRQMRLYRLFHESGQHYCNDGGLEKWSLNGFVPPQYPRVFHREMVGRETLFFLEMMFGQLHRAPLPPDYYDPRRYFGNQNLPKEIVSDMAMSTSCKVMNISHRWLLIVSDMEMSSSCMAMNISLRCPLLPHW
mmetsp:Transcript_22184/g.33793  ORF Transcript_22184/g.33793 Transcript_22184/m.33793 type:complete len:200 (+) Transcript_22184:643-1242(+)